MRRLVNLNKMDFCYWINELPELKVENKHEKVIELKQTDMAVNFPLQMALEISLHKQVSSYAMLGFSYIPENGIESLITKISYHDHNSINYLSQIRRNESGRFIYSGIDKLLSDEVAGRLIDFNGRNSLPAGKLDFRIGANCEISSSPKIFGIVTEILLNLFISMDKKKLLDNEYLDELFTENICKSRIFAER